MQNVATAPTVTVAQDEYNDLHREIGMLRARVRELEARTEPRCQRLLVHVWPAVNAERA